MRLLGAFSVEVGGRLVPASAWRLRKAAELIRVLCLAAGHRLHREQLMEVLWPDRPPDSALNNLHQAVRVARSALGQADGAARKLLVLRDGVLAFCPDDPVWIDAEAFDAIVRRLGQGAELAELMTARQLYSGEPLPDDRYAAWAAGHRERLAQDYLLLLERTAELQERDGHGQAAIDTLRELLELDPSDEGAHRSLMRLLALGNRRQQALRQFERLRTILARELEVEPSSESSMLYRDILEGRVGRIEGVPAGRGEAGTGDPAGARQSAPGLGHPPRHRPFPRRSNNLPVRLSSFIGRERELRQIGRLLDGARALTLTGPGGAGKTRLGVEAAASEIGACPDGVWLVELAAVSEPELVLQAIADVFDVREQRGASLLDLVLGYLRERSLLLLLDNCEHLVDACASVAQTLLTECPNLRILATSRQPLRIPGELIFRVPSLTIPDPDAPAGPAELAQIDSVRLFVERAQAVHPTFALSADNAAAVARLCHHLDGLPLAIELAASRVAVLPVAVIADRLDDRFSLLVGGSRTALSRQQTLRATLDWSYNLLTEPQRRMLRLLSVFAGGAPLDAVEQVWLRTTGDRDDPVVILGDLVDQSLIALDDTPAQPRYRMLESVREYGRDHLRQLGELPAAEAAHADWAIDLAERAPSGLAGLTWHSLLERLESEHENLRAALDRCLQVEPDAALRLAAGLWAFWLWHGYLAEGRRWLVRALERTETPTAVRGRALVGLASLSIRSGETAQGSRRAEEALGLYRGLGDELGACHALQLLATAAWSEDDLAGAEEHYRRSLDLARAEGHRSVEASALDGLAAVSLYKGDSPMAATTMDESLELFRSLASTDDIAPTMLDIGETLVPQPETGSVRMVFEETFVAFQGISCRVAPAYALANRGMIKRLAGDLDGAHHDMDEALDLARSIGDERAIAHVLGRLGNLATVRGAYAQARELLEECLAIRQRIGDSRGTGLAQGNLGNLAIAEGDLARAGSLLDESAAAFRRRGDMWGYASALGNLASLALATGDTAAARRWLEESLVAIRVTGRDRWTAWALLQLAAVSRLDGRPEQADHLCDEALPIFRRIGDRRGQEECVAVAGRGTVGGGGSGRRHRAKRGSN